MRLYRYRKVSLPAPFDHRTFDDDTESGGKSSGDQVDVHRALDDDVNGSAFACGDAIAAVFFRLDTHIWVDRQRSDGALAARAFDPIGDTNRRGGALHPPPMDRRAGQMGIAVVPALYPIRVARSPVFDGTDIGP